MFLSIAYLGWNVVSERWVEEGVSRACRRKGGEGGLSVEDSFELGLGTTLEEEEEGLDTRVRPRKPTA